jgi:5-methyltetrahydrofolate--homocysteine methyltransferase
MPEVSAKHAAERTAGWDPGALRRGTHVADGAWSTILRAGLPLPAPPAERLNVASPQLVRELAERYVAAGVDVLTTNTFACNRFAWPGDAAEALHLAREGAAIARAAAERSGALVVGALGPTGRILSVQEITPAEAAGAFAESARALADGGVDAIVLETLSELDELLVAADAVRNAVGLPAIACLSLDSGPQRTRTNMGVEAGDAAAALDRAGVDAIGCNCGGGVTTALPAVVALRAATQRPLWVKPNAGLPELEQGRVVYRVSAEDFARAAEPLVSAGADVIGGCCGVGPEHIQRLRALVQRHAAAR